MSIPISVKMCERCIMNAMGHVVPRLKRCVQLFALVTAFSVVGETTNAPAASNAPANTTASIKVPESAAPRGQVASSRDFDESPFRIVPERNIFNANRSGGQVRLPSRRPSRVESFTLVGTMAYDKGTFAFFEGTSSEYTKVVKPNGVIAGYLVADVLDNGVKLEADGKTLELPVGSSMRREDQGLWHLGQAAGENGSSYVSTRENSYSDPSSRESSSTSRSATTSSNSSTDESGILKRLMERREKESQ